MSKSGSHPARVYVTDCEGLLSRNSNAQELAAHFIPNGAAFFARLSRYDDLLADVAVRPGHSAGDRLRLLAPFLLAFGATDEAVVKFSAGNVLLVPGARRLLTIIPSIMRTFIISTSYSPYARALCDVTGFRFEDCRSTPLGLDAWQLDEREAEMLRDWAARIARRPIITIPARATSVAHLSAQDQTTVAELNRLFWDDLDGTAAAEIMASVRPIGAGLKLAALQEIVAELGCARQDVMYVGNSITDALALAAVRSWGGVALSFNGNAYALAAAEFAVAAADTGPIIDLARAFAHGGAIGARARARSWPATAGGLVGIIAENRDVLTAASLAARQSMRGEHSARLG